MVKRATLLLALTLFSLSLGGCSKCGFWWQEGPRACKGDVR